MLSDSITLRTVSICDKFTLQWTPSSTFGNCGSASVHCERLQRILKNDDETLLTFENKRKGVEKETTGAEGNVSEIKEGGTIKRLKRGDLVDAAIPHLCKTPGIQLDGSFLGQSAMELVKHRTHGVLCPIIVVE